MSKQEDHKRRPSIVDEATRGLPILDVDIPMPDILPPRKTKQEKLKEQNSDKGDADSNDANWEK